VPDARLNKVTGDARDDLQEPAIGDGRYAFDLSMMIRDELEMRYQGTEALPSGKRFRMDHNADKFSVRCDERVDLFCESLEVRSLKRAFGGNEKNTTVSQQLKSDHLSTHSQLDHTHSTGMRMERSTPVGGPLPLCFGIPGMFGAEQRFLCAILN